MQNSKGINVGDIVMANDWDDNTNQPFEAIGIISAKYRKDGAGNRWFYRIDWADGGGMAEYATEFVEGYRKKYRNYVRTQHR
jgi:hypothetical protein